MNSPSLTLSIKATSANANFVCAALLRIFLSIIAVVLLALFFKSNLNLQQPFSLINRSIWMRSCQVTRLRVFQYTHFCVQIGLTTIRNSQRCEIGISMQ